MKKLNFLLFGLLVVSSLLISSCKKEVKIEKNLWKKDGEWNIESYYSKQESTYTPDNFESTFNNAGTYTFNENGSGSYVLTFGGDSESGSFTYSNTEDKITFIIDNETKVFDIVEWKKNEMKITYTLNYSNSVGSGTFIETLTLKKK